MQEFPECHRPFSHYRVQMCGARNSRDKIPAKKQYYLKNNLAYTEDHVLVKKLFLYHVAPQVHT